MLGYIVEPKFRAAPELLVKFGKTVVKFLLRERFLEEVFVHQ